MQHHAQLYVAASLHAAAIPSELRVAGVDVDHLIEDTLSIAGVRRVIEKAHQAPLQSTERHIVIHATRCTHEAQNALLKVLEDPPATTRFSVVVPSLAVLLPTVRSRVQVVRSDEAAPSGVLDETLQQEFLAQSYAERLVTIQDLAKQKDTGTLRTILIDAAQWARTAYGRDSAVTSDVVAAVNQAVRYVGGSGASAKMLCEQVALMLPIVPQK